MKEFTYTLVDKDGMHARPAGRLAMCAKQFASNVIVRANGKTADGKLLIPLMMLGAVLGTTLTFSVSGEDEEKAARELEQFCHTQWNPGGVVANDTEIEN
ncbi:MAG: HPr family phosphocarrier protein [Clostridia bacterium]|nr:HPr family phosphocarrier protein [Clostridia bacterium]